MGIIKYKPGKSPIHERGLFASTNIKKGEYILTFKGKNKRWADCRKESNSKRFWDWLGIENNQWLKVQKPESYINHSCQPNTGIKGSVRLYAMKDIWKEEELTLDYSTTEIDPNWSMQCSCGKIECRNIIGPVQTLSQKQFSRYLPNIPTFVKKYHARKS